MLTLKFESDLNSTECDDATMMIEARQFRTRKHRDGSIDIYIENENGVELVYPVGNSLSSFSHCYVMNSAGQTVARYNPARVADSVE